MKHSEYQLRQEIEKMAGGDLFFSVFPSLTVLNNMSDSGVTVTAPQVDSLWAAYQKATVDQGLAPYSKAGGGKVAAPLLESMTAETGYDRLTVAAFLNGLEKAVNVQGWEWRWLDPKRAIAAGEPMTVTQSVTQALGSAGNATKAFLAPSLDPVTNLVKYAAVALVAGAVIYGVYHGSKFFKAKRRKG